MGYTDHYCDHLQGKRPARPVSPVGQQSSVPGLPQLNPSVPVTQQKKLQQPKPNLKLPTANTTRAEQEVANLGKKGRYPSTAATGTSSSSSSKQQPTTPTKSRLAFLTQPTSSSEAKRTSPYLAPKSPSSRPSSSGSSPSSSTSARRKSDHHKQPPATTPPLVPIKQEPLEQSIHDSEGDTIEILAETFRNRLDKKANLNRHYENQIQELQRTIKQQQDRIRELEEDESLNAQIVERNLAVYEHDKKR